MTVAPAIPIGPTEEIRITRVRGVVSARIWFVKHGRWLPSRKAIDLPARAATPLAEALIRQGGR